MEQETQRQYIYRCVVNNQWRLMYKEVKVEGLAGRCSDHLPVLLSLMGYEERIRRRECPFRFEASWIKEEGAKQIVRLGWNKDGPRGDPIKRIQKLLNSCKGVLQGWFRRKDKDRVKDIEMLTKKIQGVQEQEGPQNVEELNLLQMRVGVLLEQ
ncbi:uncharacterized protein LOC122316257 [Carya illinoinensis]|uniref:uncharacterized protein LOC122316257 n=1 Tax=Carya illinoinensis TaxID=32201 RepID=UPI001C72349C|nr:uncharacterized protein LOC122316257 [Carya illinoinensis]